MLSFIEQISVPVWGWLIFAVAMIVIEMMTMGLTTIWAAGGAIAALLTALFTDNFLWQALVFAVVTLILVIVTRPLAVRRLNNRTVRTNVDALIGQDAVAQTDVEELSRGEVKVDGKVWMAVPARGSAPICKGDVVKVSAVEGVKLIVKKEEMER